MHVAVNVVVSSRKCVVCTVVASTDRHGCPVRTAQAAAVVSAPVGCRSISPKCKKHGMRALQTKVQSAHRTCAAPMRMPGHAVPRARVAVPPTGAVGRASAASRSRVTRRVTRRGQPPLTLSSMLMSRPSRSSTCVCIHAVHVRMHMRRMRVRVRVHGGGTFEAHEQRPPPPCRRSTSAAAASRRAAAARAA